LFKMDVEENRTENVEDIVKCTECGSRNLERDTTRGELVCNECGLVLEDSEIDMGAEWRVFSPEHGESLARTGAPTTYLLHDKGLSTSIDWQNRDYSGKRLSSSNRSQYHRMRKWQQRARVKNSFDRNLTQALPEIARIGEKLGLAKALTEETSLVYRKALERNLTRGRSIDALVAASVYLTCNRNKLGRTLDEVCGATRVGRKELTKSYKVLKHALGIRMDVNHPVDFVPGFISKLGLPSEVMTETFEILRLAEERELTYGKSPTGIAAAAIYIAAHVVGNNRTQREIADISHVTEVTIRNRYKELANALDIKMHN
jgi:transcription initiation factor TFIIB